MRSLVRLAVCLIAFAAAHSASAATYTVTRFDDPGPGNGVGDCATTGTDCSLRDAINTASQSPGNTMVIPAGTYSLDTTDFAAVHVNATMTVSGAGAHSTKIVGNGHTFLGVFALAGPGAMGAKTATATISSATPDPNAANNAASATVTVTAGPLPPGVKRRVPRLRGKSLSAARKALSTAHCKLGRVKKPKRRKHHKLGHLVVTHQTAPGSLLPPGAKVSITLGRKRRQR